MKTASRNRQKQTNKRKKHDSKSASLPPTSQSSQPYVDLPQVNSLPPTFPPQLTSLPSVIPLQWPSLPPNIPPSWTSLPPGFPPLSTSLPPSLFSIPPSGTYPSVDSNIIPMPHINSSLSCHKSQNNSSPASSAPNISKLNIGVSVSASPSTSTITASACSKTQKVGETREYDAYHRLILIPDEDGFAPSYAGSHMVSESIQPFFNDAWGRWKDFSYNIREQISNQFRTKLKGEKVSIGEVFEEMHKRKQMDGTRGERIEPRAEETFVQFQRSLDERRQSQPTTEAGSTTQLSADDVTSIWTNMAGGVKKGRVYGLGVQPSLCHPSPLLSGASTSQFSEEIEAMRRQISELTERLQTSEANFAKVQKFMEKYMVESDSSEEETDSDEE